MGASVQPATLTTVLTAGYGLTCIGRCAKADTTAVYGQLTCAAANGWSKVYFQTAVCGLHVLGHVG